VNGVGGGGGGGDWGLAHKKEPRGGLFLILIQDTRGYRLYTDSYSYTYYRGDGLGGVGVSVVPRVVGAVGRGGVAREGVLGFPAALGDGLLLLLLALLLLGVLLLLGSLGGVVVPLGLEGLAVGSLALAALLRFELGPLPAFDPPGTGVGRVEDHTIHPVDTEDGFLVGLTLFLEVGGGGGGGGHVVLVLEVWVEAELVRKKVNQFFARKSAIPT